MSKDSPNKTTIGSLIATLQQKIEPAKLYDALNKMFADVCAIYDALFGGPLPAVSGKLLDLHDIPTTSLPPNIAYVDSPNLFTQDQQIRKKIPTLELLWDAGLGTTGTVKGRVQMTVDGSLLLSANMFWDGVTYQTDSGNGSGIYFNGTGNITMRQKLSGVNYVPLSVNTSRAVLLDSPAFSTGAVDGEVVLKNARNIYAVTSTGLAILPMMQLDANNLLVLGSNPVGTDAGYGNISIPRCVTTDLPLQGATRNGILIIDKTPATPLLYYYANGNKYKLTGVLVP